MLEHGQEAWSAGTGDPEAARAVQFTNMGYPAPYPDDWPRAAALVLADEARILAEADLYVVTPQMLDVVLAAAQTLTYDDLSLLRADDLPTPSGAVILPRPVVIRLPAGGVQEHIAYTWKSPARIPLPAGMGFAGTELPAVRMSEYQTQARASSDFAAAVRAQGVRLPPMLLDAVWCLPVHASTAAQAHDQQLLTAEIRRYNAVYWQQEIRTTAGAARQLAGEYASGAAVQDPEATLAARILYAFWRLCDQRIATQTKPVRQTAGPAAARGGSPADVRVVALRRMSPSGGSAGQDGAHQWQHHWIVRMHKVRQWYPSLRQHKVIYRGPFVKGDQNKPLLGGDIVRGLTR
jgi:hypothetical protein